MPATATPVALVLAAGSAQRFGRDKRQVVLAGGRTLLETTLANIRAAGLPVRAVVRADDDYGRRLPVPILNVPDAVAARGMGATLAAAVAQLGDSAAGCLICLGDMPFVQPQTYRHIARALREDVIVVPEYNGRPGNPVAFGAAFFPELTQLDGDRGARALLSRHSDSLQHVRVDDPGIHRDIDTVADLLVGAGPVI